MTGPRTRFTATPREAVAVDYKDVLAQAIINERWRVLREVRNAVEDIPVAMRNTRETWRTEDRSAQGFKTDLEQRLRTIERGE